MIIFVHCCYYDHKESESLVNEYTSDMLKMVKVFVKAVLLCE